MRQVPQGGFTIDKLLPISTRSWAILIFLHTCYRSTSLVDTKSVLAITAWKVTSKFNHLKHMYLLSHRSVAGRGESETPCHWTDCLWLRFNTRTQPRHKLSHRYQRFKWKRICFQAHKTVRTLQVLSVFGQTLLPINSTRKSKLLCLPTE